MQNKTQDIAIIGGGIVGMATAYSLLSRAPHLRLTVIEAEDRLGAHQTGNNSGVIHSGLYYKPGSLKAKNCREGLTALYRFSAEHGIPHERCGKIVVATRPEEIPALDELERRGHTNGLNGLKRLSQAELREIEPHAAGIAGLHVPETGIVDYLAVLRKLRELIVAKGATVDLSRRFLSAKSYPDGLAVETSTGPLQSRLLVNCAGLYSDRVAQASGLTPEARIIPFRGEYYELVAEKRHLVRHLIYPVPDARFPFLGVHFTRMVNGGIEAGPNAVLALKRTGYAKFSFSPRDTAEMLGYPGFWHMAGRYWKTGMGELHRSLSKRAFVQALKRLLPDLTAQDLIPAGSGIRAQAVKPDGSLVDDFLIMETERMIHVLNAPSPAATASLSIGATIAQRVLMRF